MPEKTMLSWIKKGNREGLVKVQQSIPQITESQALVKVKAAGICGTDFGIYKGYRKVDEGLIPGHEFCGEIVELGKDVKGYAVGDVVVPSIINPCQECWSCRNGFEAQCENLEEIGIHINGSFAEYVAVPMKSLHKVPEDTDPMVGASIEPVAVSYSAVKKVRQPILGKDVIVYGPGAIGLYITQLLILAGALNVMVVGMDGDEDRLALAERYGAIPVNISNQKLDDVLRERFRKGKANIIFDATGVAGILGGFQDHLLPRGEMVFTGIYKDSSDFPFLKLVRGDFTISGSFCYTLQEFEETINLVLAGKIDFSDLIDIFPLSALDKSFMQALSKSAIKVVLLP